MKIHPLVSFALAVASATVPAIADSPPLRPNRHLQDEVGVGLEYIFPSTIDAYTELDEFDEDRKGADSQGPKVITGNALGNMAAKGGTLNEIKVVGLVLFEREEAEIFSTGRYTLKAQCKNITKSDNNKNRIQAVVRLFINDQIPLTDTNGLLEKQILVSQIAREVNYMPRITSLDGSEKNGREYSIPLVTAEVRTEAPLTSGKNVGYQLYQDPRDLKKNEQPVFGFWGDNPGLLFDQGTATPIGVAMPADPAETGAKGALTGTGDFGRIQTSEGFHVEFTTANGNGVFALFGSGSGMGMPPNIGACFFSGDVTYTEMGKGGKGSQGGKGGRRRRSR
mmetsp:Transcript_21366/g.61271  ORF Transcript_21366/g.61271 Transcript_21366/m.61271 type:complete len:337 (+) Transcript_21366:168-1178(+)